jgi:hypothetical protein
MGDDPKGPYSEWEFRKAVLLSAFLGWAGVILWDSRHARGAPDLTGIVLIAAIGLPVALGVSWFIGGPILRRLMRNPINWGAAALGGAKAGAMLAVIIFLATWLLLLGSNGQVGYGDKLIFAEGTLTRFGLMQQLQTALRWMLLGAVTGLIVRAIIGPGRPTT